MNDAHLHMVVNHFPIIGTILGLGILIFSFLFKNISYRNIAYGLFIVSAIFAFFSMYTGEGAEEIVEDLPNVGRKIIHIHEEFAEKLALLLYLLGLISTAGLYADYKALSKAKIVAVLALLVSVTAVYLGSLTGTSGGEIRHTEIRTNTQNTNLETTPNQGKENEKD